MNSTVHFICIQYIMYCTVQLFNVIMQAFVQMVSFTVRCGMTFSLFTSVVSCNFFSHLQFLAKFGKTIYMSAKCSINVSRELAMPPLKYHSHLLRHKEMRPPVSPDPECYDVLDGISLYQVSCWRVYWKRAL